MPWTTPVRWSPRQKVDAGNLNTYLRDNLLMLDVTSRTALTLLNGWVNYGAPWADAYYEKRGGHVFVQGLIKNGTGTIATLPVGFRPPAMIWTPQPSNGAQCRLEVSSTGNLLVVYANGANNTWLAINAVFSVT